MTLKIKRIYEEVSADDGKRILVDRLWPRGVSKENAKLDEWLKEIAPSHELRKWFGHDPEKFVEFKRRYKDDLENNDEHVAALATLQKLVANNDVTLLYSTKETKYNHVQVLKEYL